MFSKLKRKISIATLTLMLFSLTPVVEATDIIITDITQTAIDTNQYAIITTQVTAYAIFPPVTISGKGLPASAVSGEGHGGSYFNAIAGLAKFDDATSQIYIGTSPIKKTNFSGDFPTQQQAKEATKQYIITAGNDNVTAKLSSDNTNLGPYTTKMIKQLYNETTRKVDIYKETMEGTFKSEKIEPTLYVRFSVDVGPDEVIYQNYNNPQLLAYGADSTAKTVNYLSIANKYKSGSKYLFLCTYKCNPSENVHYHYNQSENIIGTHSGPPKKYWKYPNIPSTYNVNDIRYIPTISNMWQDDLMVSNRGNFNPNKTGGIDYVVKNETEMKDVFGFGYEIFDQSINVENEGYSIKNTGLVPSSFFQKRYRMGIDLETDDWEHDVAVIAQIDITIIEVIPATPKESTILEGSITRWPNNPTTQVEGGKFGFRVFLEGPTVGDVWEPDTPGQEVEWVEDIQATVDIYDGAGHKVRTYSQSVSSGSLTITDDNIEFAANGYGPNGRVDVNVGYRIKGRKHNLEPVYYWDWCDNHETEHKRFSHWRWGPSYRETRNEVIPPEHFNEAFTVYGLSSKTSGD